MTTMDASSLTTFQRCTRRWKLEQTEPRGRWHPKALFDLMMRQCIMELSSGKDHNEVSDEAATRLMELAANPGLDVAGNPYPIACDFRDMLKVLCATLRRVVLTTLTAGPMVLLGPDLRWRIGAFCDEAGVLHRWCSVDKLDDDTRYRELHSWRVFGDVAAADVPMVLHIVEIGSRRHGHQHTPWCKAYRHPAIPGRFSFRHADGSPLTGSWKPLWLGDSKIDLETWVDRMHEDGVSLIHRLEVKTVSNAVRQDFIRQVSSEAHRMQASSAWRDLPMSRTACDSPYVCPWQTLCFGANIV